MSKQRILDFRFKRTINQNRRFSTSTSVKQIKSRDPKMTSTQSYSISNLPPVKPTSRLTNNLLSDPLTPKPNSILSLPNSLPSYVRRSRPVAHGSHFSFLTSLVLQFPYEFPKSQDVDANGVSLGESQKREVEKGQEESKELSPEEAQKKEQEAMEKRMEEIESVMRTYDIDLEKHLEENPDSTREGLTLYLPKARSNSEFPSARLLGISTSCLQDCLPHLSIGDSLEFIKSNSVKNDPSTYSSGPLTDSLGEPKTQEERERRELSEVLSGRSILARFPKGLEETKDEEAGYGRKARAVQEEMEKSGKSEEMKDRVKRRERELKERLTKDNGYAPWSLCYAGHQFGSWAGQLGDGRAVTLLETINPQTSSRWEIQLKGSGRSPFSRFADGLATLGSSVREFLASEAMAALKIPTSRALAIVSVPEVKVLRERVETAAITTRLNSSWLRIGSFQIHSSRAEWESVRILGEYVTREVLKLKGFETLGLPSNEVDQKPWAKPMLEEVAKRNAKTFALWQCQGFMHGVLNTDNISLGGETIDYGPYAFMDLFDQGQICNHSDSEGRYSYRMQPSMGVFAIQQLLSSISVILGFELENKRAPRPNELIDSEPSELEKWSKDAEETLGSEIQKLFTSTLVEEWKKGWRSKLGLRDELEDDQSQIIDPFLSALEDLDFSSSIRNLSRFAKLILDQKKEGSLDETKRKEFVEKFAGEWYDEKVLPEFIRNMKRDSVKSWLKIYAQRLEKEGRNADEVKKEMDQNNPKFILRNWITREVASRLQEKNDTEFLQKVLDMCVRPFEDYGCKVDGKSEEVRAEEERLCSIGTPLSGNLPSCSS